MSCRRPHHQIPKDTFPRYLGMTWIQFELVEKWLNYVYVSYSVALILGKAKGPPQHTAHECYENLQQFWHSYIIPSIKIIPTNTMSHLLLKWHLPSLLMLQHSLTSNKGSWGNHFFAFGSWNLTLKVLWWFQAQNCLKTPVLKASYSFYFFELFSWIQL
jgi:hypothetical protein